MSPPAPVLRSLWHADPSLLAQAGPATAPDAVILDGERLRHAGAADRPALVAHARRIARCGGVIVTLGPPAAGALDADLDGLLGSWPDAVLLLDCRDGRDVQQCGVRLAVREAQIGLATGTTAIIAAPGPAGFLAPRGFAGASERLRGLVFDRAAPATRRGDAPPLLDDAAEGASRAVLETLLLLGARAAGVAAYDAVSGAKGEALDAECRRAAALGFDGRIALTLAQLAVVTAAFDRIDRPLKPERIRRRRTRSIPDG